jgi:hypothetical protein
VQEQISFRPLEAPGDQRTFEPPVEIASIPCLIKKLIPSLRIEHAEALPLDFEAVGRIGFGFGWLLTLGIEGGLERADLGRWPRNAETKPQ